MNLGKNYFLKDGLFYRVNLDPKKHLLKYKGNVPAFNAKLYDENEHNITQIGAKLQDGTKFIISKEDFEKHKKEINFSDRQYYINRDKWVIVNNKLL